MNKLILGGAAAAIAMIGTAASAQPYGYYGDRYQGDRYQSGGWRDSDRDGIPDRREWNQDRDRDGRPDQYDRYDNRRQRHHHYRGYNSRPSYSYGYYGQGRDYDQRGYGGYDGYTYRGW